jgi:hypothetical protein
LILRLVVSVMLHHTDQQFRLQPLSHQQLGVLQHLEISLAKFFPLFKQFKLVFVMQKQQQPEDHLLLQAVLQPMHRPQDCQALS